MDAGHLRQPVPGPVVRATRRCQRVPGGSASVVGGEDIVVFNDTDARMPSLAFTRFMLSRGGAATHGHDRPDAGAVEPHRGPGAARLLPHVPGAAPDRQGAHPGAVVAGIDEAIANGVLKALRGDAEVQAALDEAAATVDALLAK